MVRFMLVRLSRVYLQGFINIIFHLLMEGKCMGEDHPKRKYGVSEETKQKLKEAWIKRKNNKTDNIHS